MIHNPYLIQRGEIRRPLANIDVRLSQAVNFEYMGSAEFEFGALPQSFRRIEAKKDTWRKHLVPEIKSGETSLRVYGSFAEGELEQYTERLLVLRSGKGHTKESTYFEEVRPAYAKTDFWWDLDNDVMFGFDKKFMGALPLYVVNSLIYMNEQKASK